MAEEELREVPFLKGQTCKISPALLVRAFHVPSIQGMRYEVICQELVSCLVFTGQVSSIEHFDSTSGLHLSSFTCRLGRWRWSYWRSFP